MNPRSPDVDIVQRRLRVLRETITDLERLRDTTEDALRDDRLRRAAAERLLQVAVDLAVDINAHLATSVLGRAPSTGRESFALAAEAGVLSSELATELAPSAGLRNVLVHRYVDIEVQLVAEAIGTLLGLLPRYVEQVARYVKSLPSG